jgi:N-acyl-D-amino-acid deacylase
MMVKIPRTIWFGLIILLWLFILHGISTEAQTSEALPVGEAYLVDGLGRFNTIIHQLMDKYNLPGSTLAIMKDGRLVMANAYGFADVESSTRAGPETLFRIASTSKPITAVAVLRLIQDGKLRLDDKVFEILKDFQPPAGSTPDPRLAEIKVRHLLQHSGGWESSTAGDPQFMTREIAEALGLPSPASPQTLIRYWMGQPLQFSPGTKYVYSNFGYNVLGRIIEKVTGQAYEDHVNSMILMPLGIRRMQIGKTLREQRAKDEATYYGNPGDPLVDSVFPALGKVPQAYGGWSHPALDAHGGWIASAIDLLRFVRGVEGSGGQPSILSTETIQLMEEDPKLPGGSANSYYGFGWNIERSGTTVTQWSHAGALEASNASLLVRQADGISYAVIFNSLPDDFVAFFPELQKNLKEEIAKIRKWPSYDLFPKYP